MVSGVSPTRMRVESSDGPGAPGPRTRLLVVDDHAVVRIGLAALFGTVPGFVVVGEAGTAAEAIVQARRHRPDVVVMDARLPDRSGAEACRAIREERAETRVVMLTSYSDESSVVDAIQAGAAGYVLKGLPPDQLVEAIETVAAGGSVLDPGVTSLVFGRLRNGGGDESEPLANLPERDRRLLRLIGEGKTNREIAAQLLMSEHTVKSYVSSILRKLQVGRRAELAAFVARHDR